MDSTTATRLWRVCKEANRPWPQLDDDDVIDYLIMEAVAIKIGREEQDAKKDQEVKEWQQKTADKLEPYR